MSVTVLIPAATTLLTTLDTVKLELGLMSVDTDDMLLERLIQRASSVIARECNRVFGRQTVVETLQGSASRLLGLSCVPIVSVTEVLEDGVVVVSSQYSIEDAEAGALYRQQGWTRSGGQRMWGTEALSSGYILPGLSTLRYTITYVAGWFLPPETSPTLPGGIEQACLDTVKQWYNDVAGSGSGELAAMQVGQLRVQYRQSPSTSGGAASLPPSALDALRQYRRVT